MAYGTVHVKGLAELNHAFARMSKDLSVEVREAIKDAAEPVRRRAHDLAIQNISHIGDRWSEFRIGATSRVVYIAPRERGTRIGLRKRRNLGPLLMDDAMALALEDSTGEVVRGLEEMFEGLETMWTFR